MYYHKLIGTGNVRRKMIIINWFRCWGRSGPLQKTWPGPQSPDTTVVSRKRRVILKCPAIIKFYGRAVCKPRKLHRPLNARYPAASSLFIFPFLPFFFPSFSPRSLFPFYPKERKFREPFNGPWLLRILHHVSTRSPIDDIRDRNERYW